MIRSLTAIGRGLILFALTALACYRDDARNCVVRCGADSLCPKGMTCSNELCTATGMSCSVPDAPTPPSMDAGSDAGPDAPGLEASPPDVAADAPVADAPADTGGWSPAQLPGLAVWLDAAQRVRTDEMGRVRGWGDLSAKGNDAVALIDIGPKLVSSAWRGRTALAFTLVEQRTTSLSLPDTPSLRWGDGDFAIAIVLRHRNPAGVRIGSPGGIGLLFDKSQPFGFYDGVSLSANVVWADPAVAGFSMQMKAQPGYVVDGPHPANDGLVRALVALRRGRALVLRLDGREIASQILPGPIDISNPGIPVTIGTNRNETFLQLEGEIFELLAVAGPLPEKDLERLEEYLSVKYELPDR